MTIWAETGAFGLSCAVACVATLNGFEDLREFERERVDHFTASDYDAFDRNFVLEGRTCAVGMADWGHCFDRSPLQEQVIVGQPLPSHWPVMVSRVELRKSLTPKSETLVTARYGQLLVLVDTRSRVVIDSLDIGQRSLPVDL